MAQTCSKCSRVNPAEASYCYYDGALLDGHAGNGGAARAGIQNFATPFYFPSGLICRNFDQLAQACQENWAQAAELLQQGYLENFLGGLGRADLAFAAREAARFPDRDRGLDQLLAKFPSQVLEPPKLKVEPTEINLGILQVGDNRTLELHLTNNGSRLLYGTVTVDDCKWLTLGEAPGTAQKVFQFGNETVIPVQVRGANLRAGTKPLEGRLLVESNGGNSTVLIRCEVPVKPFPGGVLAGARSPRQIAEKAKAAPKEAAGLFERGEVAEWYKSNGWTYPVQGPSAQGLGAVQQFFEALGLTAPPKVDINERFINFQGPVGASLRHTVEVKAQEKRPVFAHGVSDQPWLVVDRAQLNGRTATIGITVPSVPNRPGEIIQGKVTITSNGNQRFVLPVNLTVTGGGGFVQPIIVEEQIPVFANLADPVVASPIVAGPPDPVFAVPVSPVAPGRPPSHPEFAPALAPVALADQAPPRRRRQEETSPWVHLVPVFVLLAALLGMVIHDFLIKGGPPEAEEVEAPVNPDPEVAVQFMHGTFRIGDRRAEEVVNDKVGQMSLRFGITMPKVQAKEEPMNPGGKKRLTFSPVGVSNNTCVMIDGEQTLLGSTPRGHWETNKRGTFLFSNGYAQDGPGGERRRKPGKYAIFDYDNGIQIKQIVEVIPNPNGQPVETTYQGKKMDLRPLDTVLVKYEIKNKSRQTHKVGLRFLLDTFIGTNDGVPFLIPGQKELVTTSAIFDTAQVPNFIQALEYPSLKETEEKKGTIARLTLRLPGLETPEKVTLGAWPDHTLGPPGSAFQAFMTMWDVPVVSIHAKNRFGEDRNDSAVTMYWNPEDLEPGKTRTVGFAYGLGDLSSSESGEIGLVTGGTFNVGQEITVTAMVPNPKPGETASITLGKGLELMGPGETQDVPAPQAGDTSNTSPVTWKVKIVSQPPNKATTIGVRRSSGGAKSKKFVIRNAILTVF